MLHTISSHFSRVLAGGVNEDASQVLTQLADKVLLQCLALSPLSEEKSSKWVEEVLPKTQWESNQPYSRLKLKQRFNIFAFFLQREKIGRPSLAFHFGSTLCFVF